MYLAVTMSATDNIAFVNQHPLPTHDIYKESIRGKIQVTLSTEMFVCLIKSQLLNLISITLYSDYVNLKYFGTTSLVQKLIILESKSISNGFTSVLPCTMQFGVLDLS